MDATECNRTFENKPFAYWASRYIQEVSNAGLSLNHLCVFFSNVCVCVCVLINNNKFSLLPFEMNSLCALRLPGGITLIKPNAWGVIAFSFVPNGKVNRSSLMCIYNMTRGVPINCPRLRLKSSRVLSSSRSLCRPLIIHLLLRSLPNAALMVRNINVCRYAFGHLLINRAHLQLIDKPL